MSFVPTTRHIVLTAVIFLPLSILIAVKPAITAWVLVSAAVFFIVAVIDATVSRNCLSGIRVTLPEVVRLSVGRDGNLALSIENIDQKAKQLRVGLAFPWEIYSMNRDHLIKLPPETASSKFDWTFKALKQGRHYLRNCYLETQSNLGLWSLRQSQDTRAEIRVYPDLFRERKQLSGLFLNRGIGIHAQRQVGKGKDFEQLREYLPGDSYEDIHWKATARRGLPITKVYQIERTQQIYVMIDGSRLSARISESPGAKITVTENADIHDHVTVMERYTAAALIMGLAAQRQGDEIGLLAFDDRVRKFVRAGSGKSHYDVCRDALYTLKARSVAPDFSELFTFIAAKIRRRALLIILTNLDDPVLAESFAANVELVSRRHLVLVNMLKPGGSEPIFSNPQVNTVDDIYRKLGSHIVWRHLRDTERHLHRRGVGFYQLENASLCADVVSQYLSVKRRQVL